MTKDKKMYKEELYEEGIVKESKNGLATIINSDSDNCGECSAKIYCKPGNSNKRSLTVKDPFRVHIGDKVKVSIKGSYILRISFLIYGIPLILLLAGIFLGMQLFHTNKELFSTLFAVGLVSIYSSIIHFKDKRKKQDIRAYPEIVFVTPQKK